MGKGPEYTYLKRGHTDGQLSYEKTLNITNHQRNANLSLLFIFRERRREREKGEMLM